MHRRLHERYPFLMFVTDDADSGGGSDGDGSESDAAKTADGTDREEAFSHRIAKEREKWEKEHADTFAKAKRHDELIESQKSEAQKAIDAANKERDDALSAAQKTKREAALTIAGIPEDEWDDEDAWHHGLTAEQIKKVSTSLSKTDGAEDNQPPRQRGREMFVGGNGQATKQDETDPRKLAALIRGE